MEFGLPNYDAEERHFDHLRTCGAACRKEHHKRDSMRHTVAVGKFSWSFILYAIAKFAKFDLAQTLYAKRRVSRRLTIIGDGIIVKNQSINQSTRSPHSSVERIILECAVVPTAVPYSDASRTR